MSDYESVPAQRRPVLLGQRQPAHRAAAEATAALLPVSWMPAREPARSPQPGKTDTQKKKTRGKTPGQQGCAASDSNPEPAVKSPLLCSRAPRRLDQRIPQSGLASMKRQASSHETTFGTGHASEATVSTLERYTIG